MLNVNKVYAMATMTIKESIKNRIVYAVFTASAMMFMMIYAVASVTMGDTGQIMIDTGSGVITIIVDIMAIVMTIESFKNDREGRNLFVLLPACGCRWRYITGKSIGLMVMSAIITISLLTVLDLSAMLYGHVHPISIFQSSITIVEEGMMATAIASLFAQGSSFLASILMTCATVFAGHYIYIIKSFTNSIHNVFLQTSGKMISWILPDFYSISLRSSAGYINAYDWSLLFHITCYVIFEVVAILTLSAIIFSRKDIS